MIGSLGDIPFEVSIEKVRTFRNLTRKVSARWVEHAIVARKPTLEFAGPSLDDISMTIRLSHSEGLIPRRELQRIRDLVAGGEVVPLVIGEEFFGMFAIMDASESRTVHGAAGELVTAEVSLTLKEYIDDL